MEDNIQHEVIVSGERCLERQAQPENGCFANSSAQSSVIERSIDPIKCFSQKVLP
jgi:hypothetical protein